MLHIVNKSKLLRLQSFAAFVFVMVVSLVPTKHALAYQIPADAGNTWTVAAGSASKSTPSVVRVNVAITGAPIVFALLNNTSFMAGLGAGGTPVGTFLTPALPLATNGLQIQANLAAPCQTSSAGALNCATFGTVTYTFTDAAGTPIAVRNPVMHLSRVGGFSQGGGNSLYHGVTHTLTSAGATLGAPSPGSIGLNVAGAVISPALTTTSVWTGNCPAAAATVTAGCGSIPITGTVSTLAFNIGALRHNNIGTTPWNTNASAAADAWYVTFSFDEDFGDAPVSYQGSTAAVGTAPASHIQSNLTLGTAWTAANNNTAVLNGTAAGAAAYSASPVQVAAGADNNGALGDGAEESGVTTPFPTLSTNLIGSAYSVTTSINGATRAGQVCGWIDFNRDGVFTATEGACSAFATGATTATVTWTVPTATTAGLTYARLRASYATMTIASINGLLNSGEVEDYNLEIKPAVRVLKVLSPVGDPGTFNLSIAGTNFATGVGNGGTTGFRTVYHTGTNDVSVATNVANAAVAGVILSETGAGATVLSDYNTTSACVNAAGTTVTVGGTALAPSITIPQSITGAGANGQAQTITCTLTNTKKAASILISKTDSKSVSVSGTLNTYVISVTNQGPDPANGATISDSPLAGLTCPGALGAATVACVASNGAQCPGAAAVNTPSTITYAVFSAGVVTPTLPATGVLTFSYQCTVN